MGNRVSQEQDARLTSEHPEDGEVSPATNAQRMPGLRGGDASARFREYDTPATVAPIRARGEFDFNDYTQPLPWNERDCDGDFQIRQFAYCNDYDLMTYLAERSISPLFLREIDLFLQGHPEMASYAEGRHTLLQLRTLPPLEAYKYFLKGYTRPARYIDGIIKTEYFQLPLDFHPCPLRKKYDQELVDFFDGFAYRHDLIDQIDQTVEMGIRELALGRVVPLGLRKLISYAVWGNPVDAYKWFEYSYQDDYMPHRYLPEHVVLGQLPKPKGYAEPQPSSLDGWNGYRDVRRRMARARDQGVDVLDVLIAEYRMALVRKGHRRVHIDKLCANSTAILEQAPTGIDIVDLVMDDAAGRQGTNRRNAPRRAQPRPYAGYTSGMMNSIPRSSKRRENLRTTPGPLHVQGSELRQAKRDLEGLYAQERNAIVSASSGAYLSSIRSHLGRAERRYVNCLVRYLRDAKRMSGIEASRLQHTFTRDKMARTAKVGRLNQDFLLSMYPRELY